METIEQYWSTLCKDIQEPDYIELVDSDSEIPEPYFMIGWKIRDMNIPLYIFSECAIFIGKIFRLPNNLELLSSSIRSQIA